jgi:hypothetical protein
MVVGTPISRNVMGLSYSDKIIGFCWDTVIVLYDCCDVVSNETTTSE